MVLHLSHLDCHVFVTLCCRYEEALSLYKEVHSIRMQTLGEDHSLTLAALQAVRACHLHPPSTTL